MNKLSVKETVELVKKIADQELLPRAVKTDQENLYPRENMCALGKGGFLGLIISEKDGGAGLGRSYFVSTVKELARACASTALVYVSHMIALKAIEVGGNLVNKEKWLSNLIKGNSLGAFAIHEPGSGSNSGAITTYAKKEKDTYILNGTKLFVTSGGEADVYLVLAKTDPEKGSKGFSMFMVEKNTQGLSFGKPEQKLGFAATSSSELAFNDCRISSDKLIGIEGEGLSMVGKTVVGWGFFGAAAISVGIARAASNIALKYAQERVIEGQPIASHQAVQFMLTDIILKSETSESYLNDCVARSDAYPETTAINAFKSKLFASESAVDAADLSLQVLGGHGYCVDYIVERLYRDARGLKLHFKTSEWLKQDIAKMTL